VVELGVPNAEVRQAAPPGFHPGRAADVFIDGIRVGSLGELHPAVARAFGLEGRVTAGEIALDPLVALRDWWVFKEPSTYPPVVFDLAFEIDAAVSAQALVEAISEHAGEWLESVRVFDEFVGGQIGVGRKSLAVQVWLRAPDHTLTNEEVAPQRAEIINRVEESLGARLRGGG
jgi:phenylalanyl-tRNA synthetase beta chain